MPHTHQHPPAFVHLHQHTCYSLLDSTARIPDLVARVKEITPDLPALAITDHGNMHGAIEFYKACIGQGVQPIIGLEAYVVPGSRLKKSRPKNHRDGGAHHLMLLAKDLRGYQTLCRLASLAYIEGHFIKPRIDLELLEAHHEGLIALSGCLRGLLPRTLLHQGYEAGDQVLKSYLDVFGDDYFIELQDHGLMEQELINPMLRDLAHQYGLGMVATNDGHYVRREDASSHDMLMAIQERTALADPGRFRLPNDEFYLKSPQEMAQAISEREYPGALSNTLLVAERCRLELPIGNKRLVQVPRPPMPIDRSPMEHLRFLTVQGLAARYPHLLRTDAWTGLPTVIDVSAEEVLRRAELELRVIGTTGLTDHFLILADVVSWAKVKGIAVGPGHGASAGSLVAYALRITEVDPMGYGLLFECFLNPHSPSKPDLAVTVSELRRGEIVDHLRSTYGDDKVALVATFNTMASRAAIKDAARVMGYPYQEVHEVAKLIPHEVDRPLTIRQATAEIPELSALYRAGHLPYIDPAERLEGLPRGVSARATSVILSQEPIMKWAPLLSRRRHVPSHGVGSDRRPLRWVSKGEETVCQYDMGSVEELGFLKMDFLGLRTLSFIETTVRIVKTVHGISLDPGSFPLDDQDTYALFSRGDTAGVFQYESPGMVNTLRKLKPGRIQDLIAVNALYRPGPMENIPSYIRRHQGQEPISYDDTPTAASLLAPILEETHGIPVYQEQIMQIGQAVAGYSLGEADLLRRAMGKKKLEEMVKHRSVFETGAKAKGIPAIEANRIFDLLERFANYGFNKAHSTAYALLGYQTAYLKTHYPFAFAEARTQVRGSANLDDSMDSA